MKHQFLVSNDKRETVRNFLQALESLNGKLIIQVENVVVITTEDERLAQILDKVLNREEAQAPEVVKAPEEITPVPLPPHSPFGNRSYGSPGGEARIDHQTGKVLEKRFCEKCRDKYQPVRRDQRFCSDCARKLHSKAARMVWHIIGTEEFFSRKELVARLQGNVLPVGTRLNHDNNGSYTVILKDGKAQVEKIKE